MSADGIVALGPEGGEHVARGDRHHRVLAELPEYEVIELRFGPDFEGVNPHIHEDHLDSFYVLAGEAEFVVGEEVVRAGPRKLRRRAHRPDGTASATSGARSFAW